MGEMKTELNISEGSAAMAHSQLHSALMSACGAIAASDYCDLLDSQKVALRRSLPAILSAMACIDDALEG